MWTLPKAGRCDGQPGRGAEGGGGLAFGRVIDGALQVVHHGLFADDLLDLALRLDVHRVVVQQRVRPLLLGLGRVLCPLHRGPHLAEAACVRHRVGELGAVLS
jgi:hypothetical protein